RTDLFVLEDCAMLGQLPRVRVIAQLLKRGVLTSGMAIRTLLDRAVNAVEMLALNEEDVVSQRIASFLHLWYEEGETVVTVAEALGLSHSFVAHTIQRRALYLVTRHFLE